MQQKQKLKAWVKVAAVLVVTVAVAGAWVLNQNRLTNGEVTESPAIAPALQAQQIERGAYLAQVGNCKGCHTPRGANDYIGGVAIETPFGAVMSSNLTPDELTGIGRWGNADFWRALHNGRSRDGRLLYPAFPYEHFTRMTRQDSDALWAYFKSLPAKSEPKAEHALRFPYNTQAALAVWRALYFRPASPWQNQPGKDAVWNRGAYLVEGLGHCAACHSERDGLGGLRADTYLAGGWMNPQGWWAPPLRWGHAADASTPAEVFGERVRLLQTGVTEHKALMGPMAEVVASSTQYIQEADLQAMVRYLQNEASQDLARPAFIKADSSVLNQGSALYKVQCASCHGDQGQGQTGAYPALAGNWGVNQPNAANVLKAIQNGGYAPSTQRNPRPYGMPPFRHTLSEEEIAAVATYIRQSWGNQASAVKGLGLEFAR